ncbi:MAG: hypothetical protein AB1831_07490 [Pseudomonadota bacterium]
MSGIGLSYEQAPPFGVPLLFFLAAPAYLLLTALLALAAQADWLAGRWMPASLALTHLVTLGFLGMVMLGAVLQMLPVVLGRPVPWVRSLGWLGVLGVGLGTPALAFGLWRADAAWLYAAMALLPLGLAPLLAGVGAALARAPGEPWLVWPTRFAWLALAATVLLGLALAGALAGLWGLPDLARLTDLHVAWGLGGWIGLLVLGFAYQVVPMLQLTPGYPAWATRWLAWLVLVGLLGFGLAETAWPGTGGVALLPALAGGLAFAGLTLDLQRRRRRRIGDATLDFWRLGMGMLATSLLGVAAMPWLPEAVVTSLGIAFLLGFAASVVEGMLYKIVPFLAWFHLQAQRPKGGPIPNMKQLLPEAAARRHFRLHLAALPPLLAAPLLAALPATAFLAPWLARLGALALAASAWVLWRNLAGVGRMFRAHGGRF